MFSIVQSIWINELKARSVRNHVSVDWDDAVLAASDAAACLPEEVLLGHEVIEAVGRLPDAQRVVMLLIAGEGFSY
jgi:RNA polymerase sigma-70 factor, ECF subfamily